MIAWAVKPISLACSRTCRLRLCCALSLSLMVHPTWAKGLERFHFDYAIYGIGQPQSLQIFDDGVRTFLMWDESVDAPRVDEGNSTGAFKLNREGAYWVMQGVHSHLVLRFGQGYFHVLATGRQPLSTSTLSEVQLDLNAHTSHRWGAFAGHPAQPSEPFDFRASKLIEGDVTSNSYAQPIHGDELSWKKLEDNSSDIGPQTSMQNLDNKLHGSSENMALLAFPKGSKLLGAQAKARLRELLKDKRVGFDLTVVGYEDDSYLEDLGQERADVIKQYLLAQGVGQERVRLQIEPFTELRASKGTKPPGAKIIWHRLEDSNRKVEKTASKNIAPFSGGDQPVDKVQRKLAFDMAQSTSSPRVDVALSVRPSLSVIKQGELIHEGLARLAKSHNWTLMWRLNWDWKAVADIDLSKGGDVVQEVSQVIEALRLEGHALQLKVYEDNQVMEVVTTEVFND